MYVRLAFAIAAHLDSDILVVDEVLAVGDIQFQKKCINKMDSVATDGRTVLLVSHNMSTILGLSTKCMLLSAGRLVEFGEPVPVVQQYQQSNYDAAFGRSDLTGAERYGNGATRFATISIIPRDSNGTVLHYPETGCDLAVEVKLEAKQEVRHITVAVTIYDEMGVRLIDANTVIKGQSVSIPSGRQAKIVFILRNVRLKPDIYTIGLWAGIQNGVDMDGVRYATTFRVEPQKEDILYTAPFPGPYSCAFDLQVNGYPS